MEVFISYQHDSRETIVDIVNFLEINGRKCWYAPRDVVLSYASDIVDAISKCRIFLVFIDQKTLTSVHVLNEIEQAYKYYKEGKCAIIPVLLENIALTKDLDYYLARLQFIFAHQQNLFETKNEILARISRLLGSSGVNDDKNVDYHVLNTAVNGTMNMFQNGESEEMRVANRYYDVDDRYEKRRLKIEGEMLLPFEKKVFDDLTADKEHMNGLITTCMFAPAEMGKINFDKFDKILGFCYNEKAVFEANYDYKSDKCCFYNLDAEDPDFENKLLEYMDIMGIDKFDYVDITMGFIDWKKPYNVLKILKRHMRKDCRVFVRDVDDQVVVAYPDHNDLFKKFKKFYVLDPIAGFRSSGRRIFGYFKKIRASEIKLVHSGIDVTDMDDDAKEKLFFSWFGFIPNDFRISYNEHPEKEEYKEVIDWCETYYDDLEEAFMDSDFFFNSGYFIFAIKM